MENEIWKPIVAPIDFSGRYEISSLGRLKRLGYFTKLKKIWKPDLVVSISKAGKYMKMGLKKDGKIHNISIHRLVCSAFHPNPENKPQVNHINGIKHDNRANNLEWCTQSENIRHAQSIGIMKYAKVKVKLPRKKSPPRYKKIINIDTGEIYNSSADVSNITGISVKEVRRMLSGERCIRIPFRYITKNGVQDNVIFPPQPKNKPPKIPKIRPPKKVYIPHPKVLKKIIQFDINGLFIKEFNSVMEAANFVNSKYDTFRKLIKVSPNNFAKGFIWKYA